MDIEEQWKDIGGYEGLYQVSNFGRVRSLCRLTKKGMQGGATERNPGGILSNHECTLLNRRRGLQTYLQVRLTKNGKRKTFLVHRLVAEAFIPHDKVNNVVNHKDGNKHNNMVTNLEWVTQSYNIKHAYKKLGRKACITNKKRVRCVETGEIFESEREASRAYGIKNSSQLGLVCRKEKSYETAKGLHWEFV